MTGHAVPGPVNLHPVYPVSVNFAKLAVDLRCAILP
jgi:hypothetical protein